MYLQIFSIQYFHNLEPAPVQILHMVLLSFLMVEAYNHILYCTRSAVRAVRSWGHGISEHVRAG